MTQLFEIQLRNDTATHWTSANPKLLAGELGFETDTGKFKMGDGTTLWASLAYYGPTATAGGLVTNGTRASPILITAVGGISVLANLRQIQFIKGNGGPVTVTATPPVQNGTTIGQELILCGCDATNTVTLNSATGLELNGTIVIGSAIASGGAGAMIYLVWDGTSWNEVSRR